jgi:hypothetical protein
MKEYKISAGLKEKLEKDFGRKTHAHEKLDLYADYVKLLKEGRKTTTVRIEKGKLRYPAAENLRLIETRPDDETYAKSVGIVTLEKIVIKRFGELDDGDARRDGFSSNDELKSSLQKIYGTVPDDELVSIYHIRSAKFGDA